MINDRNHFPTAVEHLPRGVLPTTPTIDRPEWGEESVATDWSNHPLAAESAAESSAEESSKAAELMEPPVSRGNRLARIQVSLGLLRHLPVLNHPIDDQRSVVTRLRG